MFPPSGYIYEMSAFLAMKKHNTHSKKDEYSDLMSIALFLATAALK